MDGEIMEQHKVTDARMSEEQVERENTMFLYLSKLIASQLTFFRR